MSLTLDRNSVALHLATMERSQPEIFKSLQGEGATCGQLRTFIRTTGCNLTCIWCDTAYTWNWTGTDFAHELDLPGKPYKFSPKKETVEVCVEDAAKLAIGLGCPDYVITGGEPLLQQDAVLALINLLRDYDPSAYIEIETNGTIKPRSSLTEIVDQFNVSPKLPNSGNKSAKAIKRESIASFVLSKKAWFKFVVSDESELPQVQAIVKKYDLPMNRIIIMPQGITSDQLHSRMRSLAPQCISLGFGLCDRLHIHLFGAKRGA